MRLCWKIGKKKHTNLSMASIDYKKAYDFFLHSWINECMELFGTEDNVENFLEKSMEPWKLLLASNGEDLRELDLEKGIFQGDSLLPLLLVLSMVLLSLVRREMRKERMNVESLVFHVIFAALLQEWRASIYTCENCSGLHARSSSSGLQVFIYHKLLVPKLLVTNL